MFGWCSWAKQLDFVLEARQALLVLGEGRGQNLDRDVVLQLGVGRPIDSPMPPSHSKESISYGPRRVPGVGLTAPIP
jgi:hypothetical protein